MNDDNHELAPAMPSVGAIEPDDMIFGDYSIDWITEIGDNAARAANELAAVLRDLNSQIERDKNSITS